ncbi:MAG: UDP-N-acetylmuramoyl-L-alanine--D-glutamate ligase [Proteobacteria bacterium]|nr:UDP-N-acetylmuramoyl-L-alanine--D-glutamate ligase [Pseudomonadota bacterium]MBU1640840.1 UDP-N-acetylmuramoyl-L-alanine--D-glutamate ligase [Pseudomonadota bacterium]
MIDADFFIKNKNILVVGAGRSGMAALRLLEAQGCQLAISDGGPLAKLSQGDQQWLEDHKVFQEFGGHDLKTFLCAQGIVVSPGVPLDMPELVAATDKNIPVIGELELGALFTDIDIIAVTGTNGKTTVTTMIGELLQAAGRKVFVGGNIGTPLCDFVVSAAPADVLVLEVSSFQLDTAYSFHPHVAVLLNISPDHLDRYASYEAYAESKMRIFRRQKRDDLAVINGDDPLIKKRLAEIPSTIREFGRKKSSQAHLIGSKAMIQFPQQAVEEYALPEVLSSYPNSDNCLAAIMAVRLMGCPSEAIVKGLAGFKPLEHRLTHVATINDVVYIDDSKATNIGALQSALTGMKNPVHLIAGGRDKGGDYGLISKEIKTKVKTLIVIGEAADKMAAAYGDLVEIVRASSMDEAVRQAARMAQPGEVVLLSPACASFDMFSGYAERGRVFQHAVAALKAGKGGCASSCGVKPPLQKAV